MYTQVMPKNDLTGQTFGNLYVIRLMGKGTNHIYYECSCKLCGNTKIICYNDIKRNKSCGCYSVTRATKHGLFKHTSDITLYNVYRGMILRCYDKKASAYCRYGKRGITICQRWLDSFENFVSDMGPRPKGHQIDRIDNDGNYEPNNCRWVTPLENSRNNNRTIKIIIDNTEYTIAEIAKKFSLSIGLVHYRKRNNIPYDLPKQKRRMRVEKKTVS